MTDAEILSIGNAQQLAEPVDAKQSFKDMCSNKLEELVGQLVEVTGKFQDSTTPQGKNLYGKKMKKLQVKVSRLARLASA